MSRSFLVRTLALVALIGFLTAPHAAAQNQSLVSLLQQLQTVGLKQPSDSIVAIGGGSPCVANGFTVERQIGPDGVIVPFSLPAGYAFMVTGIDYAANSVATGQRTGVVLRTVTSGIVLAEGYTVNVGAPGSTAGTIALSTPMRVTSTLCASPGLNQEEPASRIFVRGFIVADTQ
jgi:hypothetical protein